MKLITTRCRMTCANKKSANARSGPIPLNSNLFCGLTCTRRHTESTADTYLCIDICGMTNYPIGPHVNGWAAQKTSYAYLTSFITTNYQNSANALMAPLQWSRPDKQLRPTNTVLFSNSSDWQQPTADVCCLLTSKISINCTGQW